MDAPALVALELVVEKLDRALELLVDHLGLDLLDRYRHPDIDADVALLQAGPVAITLLNPTDEGDRPPYLDPQPRMSQMTFTSEDEKRFDAIRTGLVEAGATVVTSGPRVFYLDQQTIEAVFGQAPTIVLTLPPEQPSPRDREL